MKHDRESGGLKRREQGHQATYERILEIAREEMRRDGVAALSLGAIARRLGMATPSLYTYITGKDEIYDVLFRRGFEEFSRLMDERPGQDGPLAHNLESVMRAYMAFAQRNPELFQLMFQRPVPGFTPSEASMAVSLASLEEARVQISAIWMRSGAAGEMSVAEARDLFIALQHGLTELHLANDPQSPVGEGRFGRLIPQAVAMVLASWRIAVDQTP